MEYLKKQRILEMTDCELINAFEQTVTEMTKAANFSARGVSPKLSRQLDWIREELFTRMK